MMGKVSNTLRRGGLRALALASILGLVGCTEGAVRDSYWTEVGNVFSERVRILTETRFDPIPANRARIEAWLPDTEVMEVRIPGRGLVDYPSLIDRRRDYEAGTLLTFRSLDNATLTFRNGVLVTTRGIAGDVLDHSFQIDGNVAGPASGGDRRIRILGLDNKAVSIFLECAQESRGRERILIYDYAYDTEHMVETCDWFSNELGQEGRIENEYWISGSRVWRSRQWAGPNIGYMLLQQVKG